jgi:hypothetical protein
VQLDKKIRSFGKHNDDFEKKLRSLGLDDDTTDVVQAPAAPEQPSDKFIKEVVHWHNVYRTKHQVCCSTIGL